MRRQLEFLRNAIFRSSGDLVLPADRLTDEDRVYYREVHGFDPFADAIPIEDGSKSYKYEAAFDLDKDLFLREAGVTIIARLEVGYASMHNRIVFKCQEKEATVDCVHTAVCQISPRDLLNKSRWDTESETAEGVSEIEEDLLESAKSTEHNPVNLPPEEHFASLKSYVAGIAEMGIVNMMLATYHSDHVNPETLPFGFNALMQKQIVRALINVAPNATREILRNLVVELAHSVPPDWFRSRLYLLDGMYDMKEVICTDPLTFEEILATMPSPELKIMGATFPGTHPHILARLAQDRDPQVKVQVAKNENLHPRDLENFALDESAEVRTAVARHPRTPQRILNILVDDPDIRTRKGVAHNRKSTPAILRKLAMDNDAAVRATIAARSKLQNSVLEVLAAGKINPDLAPRAYNGWVGPAQEVSALADLELAINVEIPCLSNLGESPIGFTTKNGHVYALRITDQPEFTAIPPSIGHLECLGELNLSRNRLNALPKNLERLHHLTILDLSANELTIVPHFFRKWREDLQNNKCELKLKQRQKIESLFGSPEPIPIQEEFPHDAIEYFETLDEGEENTVFGLRDLMLRALRNIIRRTYR
jgi:hypothetical protein